MTKRVLVVDDDQYIRELYEELLLGEGFLVESATDGEAALTKLLEGGFHLTLLDIMMPKLDGVGVLRALKETPAKLANGPIIVLTNLSHNPVIQDALAFGASAYLTKDEVTPDQLLNYLKKFLSPA